MAFLALWRSSGCEGIQNAEFGMQNWECGIRGAEGEIGEVSGWFSLQDVELVNNKKQEIVDGI